MLTVLKKKKTKTKPNQLSFKGVGNRPPLMRVAAKKSVAIFNTGIYYLFQKNKNVHK